MLKYLNTKKLKWRGFTLIEMLVAMTISVLIIGAICGVFVSSIKGKQRIYQLKEIEDNARYAMELMSREIRVAQDVFSLDNYTGSTPPSFTDSSGANIQFCRADSGGTCNGSGDYLSKNGDLITSSKVKINNLIFYVNDFDTDNDGQNDLQPRITISMTVVSVSDSSVSMTFQTTISPRIY